MSGSGGKWPRGKDAQGAQEEALERGDNVVIEFEPNPRLLE
jgi:hypothetical protein